MSQFYFTSQYLACLFEINVRKLRFRCIVHVVAALIVLNSDNTSSFNGSSMNTGSLNGSSIGAQTTIVAKRKSTVATVDSQQGQQNTRTRKERQPNWSRTEVLAFIHAKKRASNIMPHFRCT